MKIPKKVKNLERKRFGKIKVIRYDGIDKKTRKANWVCKCDCGTVIKRHRGQLVDRGRAKHCGCVKRELNGENNPNWKGGISKNNYHYKKIQIKRYPEKIRARRLVAAAIKKGKITKPEHCKKCMKKEKVHGHHTDYSKPLHVIWLCRKCHRKEHGGLH